METVTFGVEDIMWIQWENTGIYLEPIKRKFRI